MRRPDRRPGELTVSLLATAFAAALIGLGVAVVLPPRGLADGAPERAPAAARAWADCPPAETPGQPLQVPRDR